MKSFKLLVLLTLAIGCLSARAAEPTPEERADRNIFNAQVENPDANKIGDLRVVRFGKPHETPFGRLYYCEAIFAGETNRFYAAHFPIDTIAHYDEQKGRLRAQISELETSVEKFSARRDSLEDPAERDDLTQIILQNRAELNRLRSQLDELAFHPPLTKAWKSTFTYKNLPIIICQP